MVKKLKYSFLLRELETYYPDKELSEIRQLLKSEDPESVCLGAELAHLEFCKILRKRFMGDQADTFDKVTNFLREEEEQVYVIRGYAGTGKTYMLKTLSYYINNTYPSRTVAVAPTNRAVDVLRDHVDNIYCCTLHSLLGITEDIDDTTGKAKFIPNPRKSRVDEYDTIIIDEGSMVGQNLWSHLMAQVQPSAKIIIIGDPAQLPPVGEKESDALYKPESETVMTKVLRQGKESNLLKAATIIRENLEKEDPLEDFPWEYSTEIPQKPDLVAFRENKPHFREVVRHLFCTENFERSNNFAKIISFTNEEVDHFNKVARFEIFGETTVPYVPRDILVANETIFYPGPSPYRSLIPQFSSSHEFQVIETRIVIRKLLDFKGKFWEILVNASPEGGEVNLYVLHESENQRYRERLKEMLEYAKGVKGNAWVRYYNLKRASASLSYAYAITVHKSQGSTYNNVLFYEKCIPSAIKNAFDHIRPPISLKGKDRSQYIESKRKEVIVMFNKLRYTAYTRPSDALFTFRD